MTDRYYEKLFPDPGECVVVKVTRLEPAMGAYVALMEYRMMEGLILPNELSKRRFRSIHKLIKVGRQEVACVVRVDPEKGCVDLSKKRVAPEDIASTEQRFSNAKRVQLTARQVALKLDKKLDEINDLAIWPLYRKYGHAYEGLRVAALENGEEAFKGIDCPQDIKDAIIEDVKPRFTPQAVKVRVRVQCSCTGREGVTAVKRALQAAENLFDKDNERISLKIQLIASPLFNIIITATDRAQGVDWMKKALDTIRENVEASNGGEFKQHGAILIYGADSHNGGGLSSDSEDLSDSITNSEDDSDGESGDSDQEENENEEEGSAASEDSDKPEAK